MITERGYRIQSGTFFSGCGEYKALAVLCDPTHRFRPGIPNARSLSLDRSLLLFVLACCLMIARIDCFVFFSLHSWLPSLIRNTSSSPVAAWFCWIERLGFSFIFRSLCCYFLPDDCICLLLLANGPSREWLFNFFSFSNDNVDSRSNSCHYSFIRLLRFFGLSSEELSVYSLSNFSTKVTGGGPWTSFFGSCLVTYPCVRVPCCIVCHLRSAMVMALLVSCLQIDGFNILVNLLIEEVE